MKLKPKRCAICFQNVILDSKKLYTFNIFDMGVFYSHEKCLNSLKSYIKLHGLKIHSIETINYNFEQEQYEVQGYDEN